MRLTGYSIGGIPPLAHDTPARVLMDPHLLQFDIVWAAAGTPQAVFGIAPDELQRITAAKSSTSPNSREARARGCARIRTHSCP